jgi:hypothetical protein
MLLNTKSDGDHAFISPIRFTIAMVSHVFHAKSSNSKVNDQFSVKIYVSEPELFVI